MAKASTNAEADNKLAIFLLIVGILLSEVIEPWLIESITDSVKTR